MWLGYREFEQIHNNQSKYLQEVPIDYVSDLSYLCTIRKEIEENEERVNHYQEKIEEVSNLIEETAKKIKEANEKRDKYTSEKAGIFENAHSDNDSIETSINNINEQIVELDAFIAENEEFLVRRKDELVRDRNYLVQNILETSTLNGQYAEAFVRMGKTCSELDGKEPTDFENADIETADKILKEILISNKNETKNDIPDEAVNATSSTKILARCFQEEAKIERRAGLYLKEVLQKIEDNTFSMDEFEERTKKIEETHRYIHTVGHETFNMVVGPAVTYHDNKNYKKIEQEYMPKFYEQVDNALTAVVNKLDDNIETQEYSKVYDGVLDCREEVIDKLKRINVISDLVNHGRKETLKDAIKYLDIVAGWMPLDNLPITQEEAKESKRDKKAEKFRASLRVVEEQKLKATAENPTRTEIERDNEEKDKEL